MTEKVQKQETDESTSFAHVAGRILAVSYPVLAIATGGRALYQLFFKEGVTNYLGPSLTGVAAMLYLIATIGFAKRERWAWFISVVALGVETICTLIVGTLSFIIPDVIGGTAWGHFGADYLFFPLVQPLLGLIWLLHRETLHTYGIRRSKAEDMTTGFP